jgi:hypothetical protein
MSEITKAITTMCPECGQTTVLNVSVTGYDNWRNGMVIQKALPELSSDIREMLITGICGECWNNMFNDEDEPDNDEDRDTPDNHEW